ncbi:hypothetical protein BDB00DRAFT_965479 [Zychaea mexicana]|uniref:uncharacterized protein n=1 Tax=Zychaea mexicana TaxID=64656 RepID=UPI0022FDE569|nr:uncharacterized protein BDB00DRAFT_965479 [Zychaea mexicana]KAI9484394.1 hypothetical protein BDB00DRAFT_965479 [Zychaea mexicana]
MSRPQNRRGPAKPKNEKPKKKAKDPETFDDFLTEGIAFEEQGERYREGDRAQRNYERAATMYGKAHSLNDQDADCLYNWGRVLYILVGFYPAHTVPEEKLKTLDEAIEKFRRALTLDGNKTDAQYNLAQALHLRSEILQDTTEIDNQYMQSAMALQEAISLFEAVYSLQEKDFDDQNNAGEAQTEEHNEAHHDHVYHDDHKHDDKQDKVATQPDEFATVTEVEPTTAYSLIETLVSMSDTMTTMAAMLASYQSSIDLFSKSRSKLGIAEKWLAGTSEDDKEHKQARIQINLKEAQNFSAQAERSFLASKRVDHDLFQQAIGRLDEVIQQLDPRHVETMCDRGDVLGSYAELITKEEGGKPTADVWHNYAQADKSLKAALQIESKNLSILNKLGDLSIARARLDLPVAQRNKAQLLKNAEFYFKQAVDTDRQVLTSGYIGWAYSAWALEEWAQVADKKKAAAKIITLWLGRGGSAEMFGDITEDTETVDSKFIEWVNEEFFEEEEGSSEEE